MIEESHTDLLWVALGGPKQEFWMRKYLHEINVPVMLGVGAAFDFHSGNRPWAPPVIRKIGAEWLYRTVTGGKKTSLRNIKCIFQLIFILFFDRISWHFFPLRKKRYHVCQRRCNNLSETLSFFDDAGLAFYRQ